MNSVCVEDLFFGYPGTKNYILKSFSLTKDISGTIGLLGTNGCGKSTLVKLLAGILQPSKGKIILNGRSIKENRKESSIIYIPENIRLFLIGPTPRLDLNRIINNQDQVNEIFKKYQLEHLADKKIYHLSEGQRRLIAIMIAFHAPSSLILLDEPTIGFDSKSRNLLFRLLDTAKKSGKIIVIATNDSRVFPRMDELVVIQNGKVHQEGSPEKVLFDLEKNTDLIPNQIPRLINSLEIVLGRKLPRCITSEDMNRELKEWRFSV